MKKTTGVEDNGMLEIFSLEVDKIAKQEGSMKSWAKHSWAEQGVLHEWCRLKRFKKLSTENLQSFVIRERDSSARDVIIVKLLSSARFSSPQFRSHSFKRLLLHFHSSLFVQINQPKMPWHSSYRFLLFTSREYHRVWLSESNS